MDQTMIVKFAQDTLSHGAKGRNGFMKTIGVQLVEGSDALAIPEVPYVHLEPVNSKDEATESCFIRWPFHDTPAVVDAVMQVHGFDDFKRNAVKGLLNDETDPRIDLELTEQESQLFVYYPGLHVVLERTESNTVAIEVYVAEQLVHRFELTPEQARQLQQQKADESINWECQL